MKRAFTLIELLACQPKPWRRQVKSAFTLIELLVVIAIIGILASVVVVNVGSSRIKARDAKRKSDIQSLRTAMDLYFDDTGAYPTSGAAGMGQTISAISAQLSPYLNTLPTDPKTNGYYWWGWGPSDKDYAIYSGLESEPVCVARGGNTYTTWWSDAPACNF